MGKGKEKKVGKDALSARQVKYVELIADPANSGKTAGQLAEELNVNRNTIYRWNADPRVQRAIEVEIRKHAFKMLPYAWECLRQRMAKDTQALKLYYQLLGQHKEAMEVTGKDGGPVQLSGLKDMTDEEIAQLLDE